MASAASFYDLKAKTPTGTDLSMKDFEGKVLLIVNTASKCGFTPQLKALQELHEKYKDEGLVVIGFPCNQFGSQDPGNDSEIGSYCKLNYGVSFLIMGKSDVNGDQANEVFRYLKSKKTGLFGLDRIKWNFTKFTVNRKGEVVGRYSPTTKPEDIEKDIQALLAEGS